MHCLPPSSRIRLRLSICVLLLSLLGGSPLFAHAKSSDSRAAAETPAPKKKSNKLTIKPSRNNSEETRSERDRRLMRECKGLPNAGACKGYTGGR